MLEVTSISFDVLGPDTNVLSHFCFVPWYAKLEVNITWGWGQAHSWQTRIQLHIVLSSQEQSPRVGMAGRGLLVPQ